MNNDGAKIGAGFLLGWLTGRRRRGGGASVLLLVLAGMWLLAACGATVVSVPLGMLRAREVRALPQVDMAALDGLAPGAVGLFTARLPEDAAADAAGLALAYVEVQPTSTPAPVVDEDDAPSSGAPGGPWERRPMDVTEAVVQAANGRSISLQIPSNVSLLNAERVVDAQDARLRRVGYLPGQALTIEGTWQGDARLTARALFAGTPDEYVATIARTPWQMLIFGLTCGGVSLGLLLLGGVLRLLGR